MRCKKQVKHEKQQKERDMRSCIILPVCNEMMEHNRCDSPGFYLCSYLWFNVEGSNHLRAQNAEIRGFATSRSRWSWLQIHN